MRSFMTTNARVQRGVEQIDNQITDHKNHHHHQRKALDHRIVTVKNRRHRIAPDARPGKDVLDNHRPANQFADMHPHGGDHRQRGIAQDVATFGLFVVQAAQTRPGDVTLTGDVQHTGAQ